MEEPNEWCELTRRLRAELATAERREQVAAGDVAEALARLNDTRRQRAETAVREGFRALDLPRSWGSDDRAKYHVEVAEQVLEEEELHSDDDSGEVKLEVAGVLSPEPPRKVEEWELVVCQMKGGESLFLGGLVQQLPDACFELAPFVSILFHRSPTPEQVEELQRCGPLADLVGKMQVVPKVDSAGARIFLNRDRVSAWGRVLDLHVSPIDQAQLFDLAKQHGVLAK